MEAAHIVIIALGALLTVNIGLLLRVWLLLRRRNRALSYSIGTEKGHILKEIALEKEKKALEEKLKAMLSEETPPKKQRSRNNKLNNK